jgi:hypothetical protein
MGWKLVEKKKEDNPPPFQTLASPVLTTINKQNHGARV